MFDFLKFFSSPLVSAGLSIFNTYANLKANKEIRNQKIQRQKYESQSLDLAIEFDKEKIEEATREYGAIASYQIDMFRQKQLSQRQVLGYNMLKSGIGITPNDSSGQLLRYQAYMDEMQARNVEAILYYKRPKSSLNPALAAHNLQGLDRGIKDIEGAAPWEDTRTMMRGIFDLANITRM